MTRLVTFSDQRGARVGVALDDGNFLDLSVAYSQATDMLSLVVGRAGGAGRGARAGRRPRRPLPCCRAPESSSWHPFLGPIGTFFAWAATTWTMSPKATAPAASTTSELPKYPQFFTKAPEYRHRARGVDPRPRRHHPMARLRGGARRRDRHAKAATSPPSRRSTTSSAGRSPTTSPAASSSAATASGSRASRSTAPARSAPGSSPRRSSTPSTPASAAASTARTRQDSRTEQDDLRRPRDHPPALDRLHPAAPAT